VLEGFWPKPLRLLELFKFILQQGEITVRGALTSNNLIVIITPIRQIEATLLIKSSLDGKGTGANSTPGAPAGQRWAGPRPPHEDSLGALASLT
jgi:hypothetical protein